jgi:Rieske Fe-S protein
MNGWNRRELLQGVLALAGPPCCTAPEAPAAAVAIADGEVRIDLRRAPGLRAEGGSARVVDEGRRIDVIVVRTGKRRYAALDRKCTHGGGPVAYKPKQRTVQCTCWGRSEFALDGRVAGGPAKRPLRSHAVALAGDTLIIRMEGQA